MLPDDVIERIRRGDIPSQPFYSHKEKKRSISGIAFVTHYTFADGAKVGARAIHNMKQKNLVQVVVRGNRREVVLA